MASLTNKMALVTGASRGIGRATAQALSSAGAHVIVHYGRSAAEAVALVAEIRAAGGRADSAQADLSSPDGASRLAAQVRAIASERLDVFVSNAGVSKSVMTKSCQPCPGLLLFVLASAALRCGLEADKREIGSVDCPLSSRF